MPRAKAKAKTPVGKRTVATRAKNKQAAEDRLVTLLERADNDSGPGWHYVVTADGVDLARLAAALGQSMVGIAAKLGLSHDALEGCRKRQPELQDAIDAGHAELEHELVSSLLAQARKGQYACAMFLLKTRCGYRETGPQPGEAPAGPVININLPAPRDREAYLRLVSSGQHPAIEHQPTAPKQQVSR